LFFSDFFRTRRQIVDQRHKPKAESKVGSLSNLTHKPGGGRKKVFNDVDYLRQASSSLQSRTISMNSSRRESNSKVHTEETDVVRRARF
jgi:hypothetical protein